MPIRGSQPENIDYYMPNYRQDLTKDFNDINELNPEQHSKKTVEFMNRFDVKFQNGVEKINNIESSQDESKLNQKLATGLGKPAYFQPKLNCNY